MPDNSPGIIDETNIQNNLNNSNNILPRGTSSSASLASSASTQKNPVSLTVCTLALVAAAGSWLIAGYFIQSLQPVYPCPTVLAYLSIIALQVYFVTVSVPPAFPDLDDTEAGREDLNVSDVYTNRETAKIALYLFLPFSIAMTLIIKGLALFPQSSYCGGMALMSVFALVFLLPGLAPETITRYKVSAVLLITAAALLTLAEPALWKDLQWIQYASIGYLLLIIGVVLLALVGTLIARLTEHTSIQKPLIFAFIGLFWMLVGWIGFIPLHLFGVERLVPFPPDATVYWHISLVVLLGSVLPVYLMQWALTRTSVLFMCVGLGAIVPLHGVSEAVYLMEWNWINFGASLVSIAGIILINIRFKP